MPKYRFAISFLARLTACTICAVSCGVESENWARIRTWIQTGQYEEACQRLGELSARIGAPTNSNVGKRMLLFEYYGKLAQRYSRAAIELRRLRASRAAQLRAPLDDEVDARELYRDVSDASAALVEPWYAVAVFLEAHRSNRELAGQLYDVARDDLVGSNAVDVAAEYAGNVALLDHVRDGRARVIAIWRSEDSPAAGDRERVDRAIDDYRHLYLEYLEQAESILVAAGKSDSVLLVRSRIESLDQDLGI